VSPTTRRLGSGLLAAAGLLAITTLLARVIGFGRWLVFSGSVGTTCVGEVYQSANVLPNVLYEVAAGGALAAVAVPLIAGQLGRGDEAAADRAASAMLTWAVAVLVPLAVLLAVLAHPISNVLLGNNGCAEGVDSASVELGATMLVVFAPQVVLYGVGIVLAGILQAHRRFFAVAIAPLLSSVVVIATYLLYAHLAGADGGDPTTLSGTAAYTLAGGTTLGVVVLSLPLLVPVWRTGIRLRPTFAFPPGLARRAGALAAAGVLALLAQQLAVLVTVWVSNRHGGTGTVNVYTYVQAIYLLPYGVLAVPVAMSAFPTLAARVSEHLEGRSATGSPGDVAGPAQVETTPDTSLPMLATSTRVVLAAGCLGAALLVAAAVPIGGFFRVLDVGAGTRAGSASLDAMPAALLAYAPGLVGFGLAAVLTRALYVRGHPMAAALSVGAGWLVAALAPLLLLHGEPGTETVLVTLGASSSVGMTLAALALLVAVRRAWGGTGLAGVRRTAAAAVCAAAVAAAAGWLVGRLVPHDSLGTALGAGILAGTLALAIFAMGMALGDRSAAAMVWRRLARRWV
jgi:putative peptidoglycan lipid II flippase